MRVSKFLELFRLRVWLAERSEMRAIESDDVIIKENGVNF
jgi:hypothetical protein